MEQDVPIEQNHIEVVPEKIYADMETNTESLGKVDKSIQVDTLTPLTIDT